MDIVQFAAEADGEQVLDLDEALGKLEQESPSTARIVRLRFYVGLSVSETFRCAGRVETHGLPRVGVCAGVAA